MKCVVKNGQRWLDCPDHINHDGDHGEYKCKWIVGDWPDQTCINPKYKDMFSNEDFEL